MRLPFALSRWTWVAAGALAASVVAVPEHARADTANPEPPAVGFSKLIVRLDGRDEIGIASADFHVRLIERMRAKGLHAVGAENLVFGKDETRAADFLIGGTVRELACTEVRRATFSCRIGVEWQVLDVRRDKVTYTVLSRAAVNDHSAADKEHVAALLLDGAMDSLLRHDTLREVLSGRGGASPEATSHFREATIARCAPGKRVSESADDLLQNVVVIKGKTSFGSGFFVSPDGLLMTAAHVVDGPLRVRLRDGTETDAVPVRVAPREDVALLRTTPAIAHRTCAVLREDTPPSGTEVYAAGAPASIELAFSLTRGIVSGFPIIDGQRRLQTDAPVNPGNSGGPIADGSGAALGIVSFKIVSSHIEGVAFAVPVHEALTALGLRLGDPSAATDPGLQTEKAAAPEEKDDDVLEDQPDPVPSLDPEGDRRRLETEKQLREQLEAKAIAEDRYRRTPTFAKVMRWGGLALAVAGAIAVPVTYAENGSTTTQPDFDTLRTWNTVGWIALVAGAGSFGLSYVFQPPARPSGATGVTSSLEVGPAGVTFGGSF